MARKTSRGRQRIPMEKMQNESSLQVTFSKRRSGIMKKCNELSTLTGAEMAVVIFSPGNKAFSFGNPSVETVLNRFQNKIPNDPQANSSNTTLTNVLYQNHQQEKLKNLHARIEVLKEENEAERKLKEIMDRISEIEENNNLCLEGSLENLSMEQLQKLKDAYQELNQLAENKMKKLEIQEIQREPSFNDQDGYEQPRHDAPNIENASGYMMPTFANYGVASNVFGLPLQGFAGPSSFGGGGFHFIPDGASSSTNNGVQMGDPMAAAPAVGSFVLQPYYGPIQGYGPLF